MNKRLAKKHARQVARAKERVRHSEPDVRTPEQVTAAREASRAASGWPSDPRAHYSTRPSQSPAEPGVGDADKDVGGM